MAEERGSRFIGGLGLTNGRSSRFSRSAEWSRSRKSRSTVRLLISQAHPGRELARRNHDAGEMGKVHRTPETAAIFGRDLHPPENLC